jgi:hypothetical protein
MNNFGCLNQNVSYVGCLDGVNQTNVVGAIAKGVYGAAYANAASGINYEITGVEGDAYSESAAGVSYLAGVIGYAEQDGSGTTNYMASFYANPNYKATGTVTNNIGLLVGDQAGVGTNNYGVYTQGTSPSSFGGAVVSGLNSVSFSATPTFDASKGNTQKITLTGNVTSSTLSNCAAGEFLVFDILQDGVGSHTFVWPTAVLNAGTIGSTLSKHNIQSFYCDGSNARATAAMLTNQN